MLIYPLQVTGKNDLSGDPEGVKNSFRIHVILNNSKVKIALRCNCVITFNQFSDVRNNNTDNNNNNTDSKHMGSNTGRHYCCRYQW